MRTGQGEVAVLCGWEGNRRSGVAPAGRSTIGTYRLNGVRTEDEHRLVQGVWHYYVVISCSKRNLLSAMKIAT